MMNVNIRTSKKEGETSLMTYLRIGNKNHVINLHLIVDIKRWLEISTSKKKIENFLDRTGYSQRLVEIEFGIKELKRNGDFTYDSVMKMVEDIVLREKRERNILNKRRLVRKSEK